ncbi:endoribonuclease MazF [Vibrio parahaemolyticus]|nr:endoribonuclease MazF [Vibrio parahaemolyticus]
MSSSVPEKGDIILMSFNPQAGREQAGDTRPALVVSPKSFNSKTGFCVVCPITNQKKGYPFEVDVDGANKATGVILADQFKSLDWKSRKARVVDSVNNETLKSVRDLITMVVNA